VILFCDTSALVKLYVEEVGSAAMLAAVAQARLVAVVRIAWAEAMAALARRLRERPADAVAIDTVRARLRDDWSSYAIVEVTQPLVELAALLPTRLRYAATTASSWRPRGRCSKPATMSCVSPASMPGSRKPQHCWA